MEREAWMFSRMNHPFGKDIESPFGNTEETEKWFTRWKGGMSGPGGLLRENRWRLSAERNGVGQDAGQVAVLEPSGREGVPLVVNLFQNRPSSERGFPQVLHGFPFVATPHDFSSCSASPKTTPSGSRVTAKTTITNINRNRSKVWHGVVPVLCS